MKEVTQSSNKDKPEGNTAGTFNDLNLWRGLLGAKNSKHYVDSWLALQCSILDNLVCAAVILGPADKGPYTPVSFWPAGIKHRKLAAIAEKSLQERKSYIVDAEEASGRRMAHPIILKNKLHGVVVVEVSSTTDLQAQDTMRLLQWGCAWLESLLLRQDNHLNDSLNHDLAKVLEMTRTVLEQETLHGAAIQLVNDCASQLNLSRVSVGFRKSGSAKIMAISHNSDFEEKMNLVRCIEAAMNESIDQQQLISFPEITESANKICAAHSKLVQQNSSKMACSIPLLNNGVCIGALTLESDQDSMIDSKTLELCKRIALFAGNILDLKMEQERSMFNRWGAIVSNQVKRLLGPGYIGRKLSSCAFLLLMLGIVFVQGQFRITARSFLEGSVQSAIVAPFDSYVATAPIRAGDIVEQDTLLVSLDDRDLRLELITLETQLQQVESQLREAMSNRERAQINVFQAQTEQLNSQINLVEEQISRTKLTARFAGVVVSGDLSQSLGAPLRKGEVLFEIAPLDSYRMILEVDDHDIAQIDTELGGKVVLSAFPDQSLDFKINRITPVATAREGRNYFRVEAELLEPVVNLRPGMEGIAKIEVDRRNLTWILTRGLVDWFRLWAWTWIP